MKNKKWIWITGLFLAVSFNIAAQNPIDNFITDYEGKTGVTTVTISSGMLKLIDDVPELNVDIKDIRSMLTGLKIFICIPFEKSVNTNALYKTALKLFTTGAYEELLSTTFDGETIKFFVKPASVKGSYSELTLITYSSISKELVMISLFGNIDMNLISKIMKAYK